MLTEMASFSKISPIFCGIKVKVCSVLQSAIMPSASTEPEVRLQLGSAATKV